MVKITIRSKIVKLFSGSSAMEAVRLAILGTGPMPQACMCNCRSRSHLKLEHTNFACIRAIVRWRIPVDALSRFF